jgi:hypothetical protein
MSRAYSSWFHRVRGALQGRKRQADLEHVAEYCCQTKNLRHGDVFIIQMLLSACYFCTRGGGGLGRVRKDGIVIRACRKGCSMRLEGQDIQSVGNLSLTNRHEMS